MQLYLVLFVVLNCAAIALVHGNDGNSIKLPLDVNSSYSGFVQLPVNMSHSPNSKIKQLTKFFFLNIIMADDDNNNNVSNSNQTYNSPTNCVDILCQGNNRSGIYNIYPKPWTKLQPYPVFCDMETDGGGWLVFQRRGNYSDQPSQNFTQDWNNYTIGFGSLDKEFWLGNDKISFLTEQDVSVLRIDMSDFIGNTAYAMYNVFHVASEADLYRLTVENYEGNAGDSLGYHSNATFVTYDVGDVKKCALTYRGGWWYRACHYTNLNGLYLGGQHASFADGIEWFYWKGYYYSLANTEMKMRPKLFNGC